MANRPFTIPLAWLQLSWDKLRLAAALAGIIFAVVLMLMQLGFRDALFAAAVQVHQRLNGDLVLLSSQYEYLIATKPFSQRYLYQALAVDGVEVVAPIYVGLVNWKNEQTFRELQIFMIGYDPATDAVAIPEVREKLPELKKPDVILYDSGSKDVFGPVKAILRSGHPFFTEVGGRRVEIAGLFPLGISFGSDGNIITSDLNFLRLMPGRHQGLIDMGLIRLKPGVSAPDVQRKLRALLPPEVRVLTLGEFNRYEQNYWAKRTPVGFIFDLGALVGFVVGAVIVYQILYTDVTDHLGEYATLKAMGYTDGQLSGVVIKEALILSVLGFIPGLILSTGMSILTRKVTLLPSYMTFPRAATVFVLTVAMCVGSGIVAMRKLRSADPADIF